MISNFKFQIPNYEESEIRNLKSEIIMSNIEIQNPSNEKSIGGVISYLVKHPLDAVIYRWNWKAAVLSALLRSPIFLVAYRKEGLALAFGAAFAQFFFRTLFAVNSPQH